MFVAEIMNLTGDNLRKMATQYDVKGRSKMKVADLRLALVNAVEAAGDLTKVREVPEAIALAEMTPTSITGAAPDETVVERTFTSNRIIDELTAEEASGEPALIEDFQNRAARRLRKKSKKSGTKGRTLMLNR
jgi:hypothetical protein